MPERDLELARRRLGVNLGHRHPLAPQHRQDFGQELLVHVEGVFSGIGGRVRGLRVTAVGCAEQGELQFHPHSRPQAGLRRPVDDAPDETAEAER